MNVLTTARIGAYLIAAIAGAMSYGHQLELLGRADLGAYAYAVPLTVDVLAFIAAMVRNSDVPDETARKAAMWTLVFAGTASIAANVAEGENLVQRIVGFWTVAAYLLAEWFVSRLKAKPVPQSGRHCAPGCTCGKHSPRRSTRRRSSASRTSRPRNPRRTPVQEIEALTNVAPVSPAPIG